MSRTDPRRPSALAELGCFAFNCRRFVYNGARFCIRHACRTRFCSWRRVTKGGYCLLHEDICGALGCLARFPAGRALRYCRLHEDICGALGCPARFSAGRASRYCLQHLHSSSSSSSSSGIGKTEEQLICAYDSDEGTSKKTTGQSSPHGATTLERPREACHHGAELHTVPRLSLVHVCDEPDCIETVQDDAGRVHCAKCLCIDRPQRGVALPPPATAATEPVETRCMICADTECQLSLIPCGHDLVCMACCTNPLYEKGWCPVCVETVFHVFMAQ